MRDSLGYDIFSKRNKEYDKEREHHDKLEAYSKKYSKRISEEEIAEQKFCYKQKRRCNVCPKVYVWEHVLVPEDVEAMAYSIKEFARYLVCSDECFRKLFKRKKKKRVNQIHRYNDMIYGAKILHSNMPMGHTQIIRYAMTKIDQEHYY